jgi:hypothetical protein
MSEYRLTADEKRDAIERAKALREKLTGPAVPPGGEELREAIGRVLDAHTTVADGVVTRVLTTDLGYLADAVLALPAVRDALAAQEALRRVRAAMTQLLILAERHHSEWEMRGGNCGDDDSGGASADAYMDAHDRLRRAIAGES